MTGVDLDRQLDGKKAGILVQSIDNLNHNDEHVLELVATHTGENRSGDL